MQMQTESSLTQENQLEAELEKLFVFQDKNLSKEKRLVLTQELLNRGYPFGAIIKGLRSLTSEELPNLKLGVLVSAIRKFIEPEQINSKCVECMSGIILMRDQEKRIFSLRCNCEKGLNRSGLELKIWDGENSMMSNGRLLEKV